MLNRGILALDVKGAGILELGPIVQHDVRAAGPDRLCRRCRTGRLCDDQPPPVQNPAVRAAQVQRGTSRHGGCARACHGPRCVGTTLPRELIRNRQIAGARQRPASERQRGDLGRVGDVHGPARHVQLFVTIQGVDSVRAAGDVHCERSIGVPVVDDDIVIEPGQVIQPIPIHINPVGRIIPVGRAGAAVPPDDGQQGPVFELFEQSPATARTGFSHSTPIGAALTTGFEPVIQTRHCGHGVGLLEKKMRFVWTLLSSTSRSKDSFRRCVRVSDPAHSPTEGLRNRGDRRSHASAGSGDPRRASILAPFGIPLVAQWARVSQ